MLTLAVATRAQTFERMAEPLAERGVEVEHVRTSRRTVDLTGRVSGSDDYANSGPEPFPDVDPDVGFVFPPRDVEGGVADALLDVPWLNDRRAVQTSRNKAEVLSRCARAGLPVPETVLVSNPLDDEDALRAAIERVGPPVVIKPTSTTRGVGVAKVGDVGSALGVTDYLDLVHDFAATGDRSFLVQAFREAARDVRVMTIEGEYVGAVERERSDGGWRHNVHRGAAAQGVEPAPALRELAESVSQLLEVDLLGVDLLVSRDGAVVSETNARPTIDDAAKYEPGFYDRLAAAIERATERSDGR